MLHTIADLNNKLNALENEKARLLTITRLLQSKSAETILIILQVQFKRFRIANPTTATVMWRQKYLKIFRGSRVYLQQIDFLYLIPKGYMMIKIV